MSNENSSFFRVCERRLFRRLIYLGLIGLAQLPSIHSVAAATDEAIDDDSAVTDELTLPAARGLVCPASMVRFATWMDNVLVGPRALGEALGLQAGLMPLRDHIHWAPTNMCCFPMTSR